MRNLKLPQPFTPGSIYCKRTFMLYGYEGLSSVKIEPGQTLVRAFEVDDEVDRIRNNFVSSIMQCYNTERFQVTVSLMQYK